MAHETLGTTVESMNCSGTSLHFPPRLMVSAEIREITQFFPREKNEKKNFTRMTNLHNV